jgi:hypothetical protein
VNTLKKTRNWQSREYKLTFHYVEEKKQAAVFNVIHLQGLLETHLNAAKAREGGAAMKQGIHPLEFSILVDVVDFSVQDNTPNAKFLHEIK